MTCADSRPLLHAHVDGELDLVRDMEVSEHLKQCPACKARHEGIAALRSAVGERASRHRAPAALRARLQAAAHLDKAVPQPVKRLWFPQVLAAAASIALALFAGYTWGGHASRGALVADEAMNAHIRSLQEMHPLDVISTDRHTVKPWFAGKLDFSPPVVDLADSGYPLAGARLEEIDGHTAAGLVFHRKLHTISLYIWQGAGFEGTESRFGYSARGWSHNGLSFLVVSDIPEGEVAQFAALYREKTD